MSVLRPPAAAAAAEWGSLVRANNERAQRVREDCEPDDHYAPVAAEFRADPRREDDPLLTALRALARPDDVWLDVGAGTGCIALALASSVRELIAIEHSAGMRAEFEDVRVTYEIANAWLLDQRWPPPADLEPPHADVVSIMHVGYDIAEFGAFLDTMQRAARRRCVAVMFDRSPGSMFAELWPQIHGEPHAALPGLRECVVLLLARGLAPEIHFLPARSWSFDSFEVARTAAQRRLWLTSTSDQAPTLDSLLHD